MSKNLMVELHPSESWDNIRFDSIPLYLAEKMFTRSLKRFVGKALKTILVTGLNGNSGISR